MRNPASGRRNLVFLAASWGIGLVLSGVAPYDRLIWALEVLPAVIALPILWLTRKHHPFSTLVYALILVHGLVLMLGAAYTYARTPVGFLVQDWLQLERNPYDRFAHVVQGFVPALIARELLIVRFGYGRGPMLNVIIVCICVAISAFYELIEWWGALAIGEGANAFLGTQGDPRDTQADIFMALIGAIMAVVLLARAHDRSMAKRRGVT